jgi:hypothetical protein
MPDGARVLAQVEIEPVTCCTHVTIRSQVTLQNKCHLPLQVLTPPILYLGSPHMLSGCQGRVSVSPDTRHGRWDDNAPRAMTTSVYAEVIDKM